MLSVRFLFCVCVCVWCYSIPCQLRPVVRYYRARSHRPQGGLVGGCVRKLWSERNSVFRFGWNEELTFSHTSGALVAPVFYYLCVCVFFGFCSDFCDAAVSDNRPTYGLSVLFRWLCRVEMPAWWSFSRIARLPNLVRVFALHWLISASNQCRILLPMMMMMYDEFPKCRRQKLSLIRRQTITPRPSAFCSPVGTTIWERLLRSTNGQSVRCCLARRQPFTSFVHFACLLVLSMVCRCCCCCCCCCAT